MTSCIKAECLSLPVLQRLRESVQLSLDRLSAIYRYYQHSEFRVAPSFTGSPQVRGVRFQEMCPGTIDTVYIQMDLFALAAPEDVARFLQHPDTQSRARKTQTKCSLFFSGIVSDHDITLSRMSCPGLMLPQSSIVIHVATALEDDSIAVTCSSVDRCPGIPPLAAGLPEVPGAFAAYIVRPQPYLSLAGSRRTGSAITLLLEARPMNLPGLAQVCPPQDWATTVVPIVETWANAQVEIATSLSQGLPINCMGAMEHYLETRPTCVQGAYGPLTATQEYYRLNHYAHFSLISLLGAVVRSNKMMADQITEAETKARSRRRRGRQGSTKQ